MKSNKSTLEKLYSKRQDLILEGKNIDEINCLIREEEINYNEYLKENVSATGGPSGAVTSGGIGSSGVALGNASITGMGNPSSPQPSSFAGVTTEPGYSAGGGFSGNTISHPYNAGPKRTFIKTGVDDRTGRKNRRNIRQEKELTKLRAAMKSKKQDYTAGEGGAPKFSAQKKSSKIVSFDNFMKDKIVNQVTHVKK